MDIKKIQSSFMIENTVLENFSFNLVHYFLDRHGYSIFNFEEKILENFNHPYYHIVYVYSKPLFNDVNIETLFEKIAIIKKKLKRDYLLFNPSILILATNCTLDFSKIDMPKNVDFVNATEKEKLYNDEIFKQVYPDVLDFSIDLSFEDLSIKLNAISILMMKKLNSIFNKKHYIVNLILVSLIILIYLLDRFSHNIFNISQIIDTIVLSRDNIKDKYYFSFLTNNLYDPELFSIGISVLLILTFGVHLEKIYGSLRYLGIILITMIFTNAMLFAFINSEDYIVGFTPIIYTYIGSFFYVVVLFRRYLAHTLKRILKYNLIFFILILFFGSLASLISLIASLIAGFVCAFIIGVSNVKNGNNKHRVLAFVFVLILIILCILIGLK